MRNLHATASSDQQGNVMLSLNPIKITPRDEQVLQLLVQGRSNKEIAAQLNISPRTVMNPTVVSGNKRKVTFAMTVPPKVARVDSDDKNHMHVEIAYAVWTATGQDAGHKGTSYNLNLNLNPTQLQQIDTNGLGYGDILDVAAGRGFVLSLGGVSHYIGSSLPIFLRDCRQGARTDGATVQAEVSDIVTDSGANLTAIPV
jgi:hypothetical protein